MGLFDELRKLTKPYNDDEYDEFEDELPDVPAETPLRPEPAPRRYNPPGERRNPFSDLERPAPVNQKRDKVVNLNPQSQVQLVLVKPERFEAAAEIADHLRARRPVLLNLEQTQKDVARRLIDFLSGAGYALDGKVRRVAASTFIITPYNVDIMGDMMDELEGVYL
ncbi:MAG: cell division protein SepF [Oscillospiraceae bacterium]|jgi:cell division inhibitor SepF|nr:cell division protein SepF [Oscillospiraceae bacterium]